MKKTYKTFRESLKTITEYYLLLVEETKSQRLVGSTNEWVLDNYYMISEQEKVLKDPGLVTIFLMPPSLKKLEERIRARKTESDEVIQERLQKGIKEMAMSDRYEYVVLNDRVSRAAKEISNIIKRKMKELGITK